MKRLLLAVSAFAVFGAAAASAGPWSIEKTAYASKRIKALVGGLPGQAPAVSVGVSINGKLVFATGAGQASPGTPANEFTVYAVGSVSKQLTAATMLAMIEKKGGGAYSLETKVKDTLPDSFPFSTFNTETVRNLLNQRTGYAIYTKPPAGAALVPDISKPIDRGALRGYVYSLLRQFPSQTAPGTQFAYNNTNFYLASLMIEKLGGYADYRDAMKELVFAPAGMTQSGFVGALPGGVTMAQPFLKTGPDKADKPHWPRGAGDVISNPPDILKWHAAFMGLKIFSNKMRLEMATPPPGGQYGMGLRTFVIGPIVWLFHEGIFTGYSSYDGILVNSATKEWTSAVVLASNDGVPVKTLTECLAQLALDPSESIAGLGASAKLACQIPN